MKTVYELAVINVKAFDSGAQDTRRETGDKRFRDTLKNALWMVYLEQPEEYAGQRKEYFDEMWNEWWRPSFIPDLWRIDSENRIIFLYEIEDTHPLSDEKLNKLHNYWWVIENEGWDIRVTVFDRYGLNPRKIDLTTFAYGIIPVLARHDQAANQARHGTAGKPRREERES